MLSFALNHMTTPSLTMDQLMALTRELGMSGVELRNDLAHPLFDGRTPGASVAGDLTLYALAEVKAFNAFDDRVLDAAIALMDLAVASGAHSIVLIPQVGEEVIAPDGVPRAIAALAPALRERGVVALIEPIGFECSTLRFKSEVVDLIEAMGVQDQFGLIHDTFHHALSGETTVYPKHTKIVHISGVSDATMNIADLHDHHRGLVDDADRLGNIAQIKELLRGGYDGPLSFEAFSPDVHADIDRAASLLRSIHFIETQVMAHAA